MKTFVAFLRFLLSTWRGSSVLQDSFGGKNWRLSEYGRRWKLLFLPVINHQPIDCILI